jgi:hypothetical protein
MAGHDRPRREEGPARNAGHVTLATGNCSGQRRTARLDGSRWPEPVLFERLPGNGRSGAGRRHSGGVERRSRSGHGGLARRRLGELGREIVYAPNLKEENALKLRAFLNVDIFKRVLDYYKGSNLPEMKYLGNTLSKEFDLHPETHEEFSRTFRENCQYLGITSGIEGLRSAASDGQSSEVDAPETVILAEGSSNLKAFVIMPFVERDARHSAGFFAEVLRSIITPAAQASQFTVKTANRHGSDLIQSTIVNDLMEADLVIADLTEHNPNVMFELGMRMAEDKPVVLIKAQGTGPLFVFDNMRRVLE